MDTKKRILIVGAAALIVMGLIVAANAAVQGFGSSAGRGWMHGGWGKQMKQGNSTFMEGLGLPANATREEIGDALWEKQIKDLGLTDESTLSQYHQALKAKMQSDSGQRMQDMIDKLNLPANASKEDVMNALKQWRGDNEELLQGGEGGRMHRGGGFFGKGCQGKAAESGSQ